MMLKNVPAFIDAELLWVLASMGHGDELAIVDRNFSAARVALNTHLKKLVVLNGLDAPTAIAGILELMPLDHFVEQPLAHMEDPMQAGKLLEVHSAVQTVCSRAEARKLASKPIERLTYYTLAEKCMAVVQTSEDRPYGNFILKKGVV
jgi:L-fucose mutarotase